MKEPMSEARLEELRAQAPEGDFGAAWKELLAEVDRTRAALARVTDNKFTEDLAETLHYAHGYDDYGVANEEEIEDMMELARPVLRDIRARVAGE